MNNVATGKPYFAPALTANDAVYAIWIGTNDLGVDAFLTDSQVPGNTLTDYVNCVYTAMDQLYATGARYFVLMNLAPLELSPLYGNASVGGVAASHYWPDKPANLTAIGEQMKVRCSQLRDHKVYTHIPSRKRSTSRPSTASTNSKPPTTS